jgi:hypothetical protein
MLKTLHLNKQRLVIGQPRQWEVCLEGVKIRKYLGLLLLPDLRSRNSLMEKKVTKREREGFSGSFSGIHKVMKFY